MAIRTSTGGASCLGVVGVDPLLIRRPLCADGEESESLVSLLMAPGEENSGTSRPHERFFVDNTGVDGRILRMTILATTIVQFEGRNTLVAGQRHKVKLPLDLL